MKLDLYVLAAVLSVAGTPVAAEQAVLLAQVKSETALPSTVADLKTAYSSAGSAEERQRIIAALEAQAKTGNHAAILYLGDIYSRLEGVPHDAAKALEFYGRGTELGNEWAMFRTAEIYREGKLVPADMNKAIAFYEMAAAKNNPLAKMRLGDAYLTGDGVEQDLAKASSFLEDASLAGNEWASLKLGDLYTRGQVPQDGPRAIGYYEKAAADGAGVANVRLGDLYASGTLVEQDLPLAVEFYRKGVDAKAEGAGIRLGEALILGRGTEPDFSQGVALIESAADAGDNNAKRKLGDFYLRGPIQIDVPKALAYYEDAAKGGDALSLLRIGDIFREGLLIPADLPRAVASYQAAADLSLPIAKARLGEAYIRGQGVTADVEKGLGLIREAAIADLAAQKTLGDYISRGDYTQPDAAVAIDLYKRSGDAGNAWAYFRLGEIYRDGLIVTRDARQAVDYFKKASEHGLIESEIALARGNFRSEFGKNSDQKAGLKQLLALADAGNGQAAAILSDAYYWGNRVPRDPAKALGILEKASKAGSFDATRKLIAFYRDAPGKKIPRSLKKARSLLEKRGDQFNPGQLAREQVLLAAADASGVRDYAAISELVRGVAPALQLDTLMALKNANPNAFVFIAQTEMKRRSLYKGPVNGLLTMSTIKSINKLCSGSVSGERCKKGPLDAEATRVIAVMIDPSREI